MREINHNARLKGVNQKFEPRQSETFVRGRTKVFKKAGSVSLRADASYFLRCTRFFSRGGSGCTQARVCPQAFLSSLFPSPLLLFFCARPISREAETLATQAMFLDVSSVVRMTTRCGKDPGGGYSPI